MGVNGGGGGEPLNASAAAQVYRRERADGAQRPPRRGQSEKLWNGVVDAWDASHLEQGPDRLSRERDRPFKTSYSAMAACQNATNGFSPTLQEIIGQVVNSAGVSKLMGR